MVHPQPNFMFRSPQAFHASKKKNHNWHTQKYHKEWLLPTGQPPVTRSPIKRLGTGEKAKVVRERDIYQHNDEPQVEDNGNETKNSSNTVQNGWENIQNEINLLLTQEKSNELNEMRKSPSLETMGNQIYTEEQSPMYEKFVDEQSDANTSKEGQRIESITWRKEECKNERAETLKEFVDQLENIRQEILRQEEEPYQQLVEEKNDMIPIEGEKIEDKLSSIAFDIPLLQAIKSQIKQREHQSNRNIETIEQQNEPQPCSSSDNRFLIVCPQIPICVPNASTPPSELEHEKIPDQQSTPDNGVDGFSVPINWVSLAEPEHDAQRRSLPSTVRLTVTVKQTPSPLPTINNRSKTKHVTLKRKPDRLKTNLQTIANIQIKTAPIHLELSMPATSTSASDVLLDVSSKKVGSKWSKTRRKPKNAPISSKQPTSSPRPIEIPNEEKILKYFGMSNRVQLMNLKQFKFLTPEQIKDVSSEKLLELRNLYGSYRVACLTYIQNAIFQLSPKVFNVSALFGLWQNVGAWVKNPNNIADKSCQVCSEKKTMNTQQAQISHLFSELHLKNYFEKHNMEPPEVVKFLTFLQEENERVNAQDANATPSTLSIFTPPVLEDLDIDTTILKHFSMGSKDDLLGLPQFSMPYTQGEHDFDLILELQFKKYRDVCLHYLKTTILALHPEDFYVWPLFKVFLGTQKWVERRFLQFHHDGLKAIVQESPQVCSTCDGGRTKNIKIGCRAAHIFSPSHIIQYFQRTSSEPPEILAYLKVVVESTKSFDTVHEFSILVAAAKQKNIIDQRTISKISGESQRRKRTKQMEKDKTPKRCKK